MKNLKVFGERNTGTNYLTKLLESNLEVKLLRGVAPFVWRFESEIPNNLYFDLTSKKNLGWKHSYVEINEIKNYSNLDNLIVITITKNPYSYLLSLFKKPHHYTGSKPKSFNEFLSSNWYLQRRDNISNKLENPVHLWNVKNASYIQLRNTQPSITTNITYENLIANPVDNIKRISKKYSLEAKGNISNIIESTKNPNKNYHDYVSYYLDKKWMDKLNKKSVELINSYLDKDVMKYFGYDIIEI